MRPDEGWIALPLVLVLAGTMAWSISDARWILGNDSLTTFLIWIALAAAGWGYLSARLDLSPWLAQALGCIIGAFVLIEAVGASLPGSTPGLVGWFSATANSVTQAYLDLAWRHQISTLQVGHFCLILGVIVWGTAQAASYDIFGYHRAVNGVLLLAVVLIANMALTAQDQFGGLVVFSAAALAVLLMAHAADERSNWLRHRIWRGRDFQAPHLQGGMAFASLAIAGSLVLTSVASSAPLASTFNDLGAQIQSELGWLSGYLPNGGASRYQPTSDFGPSVDIKPSFNETSRDVFTARITNGGVVSHWRLVSYDEFQTTGWSIGPGSREDQVASGGTLDAGTLDLVTGTTPGRGSVSIVIHVQDSTLQHLVVANEPDTVNAGVQRTLVGDPASTDVAWLSTDATDYTLAALVPDLDPAGNGLTEWRLQHAGSDYPPGLLDRYTQGATLVGPEGNDLLTEIADWAQGNGNSFTDEYDVAKAIQDYLRSDVFTYSTDITAAMPRCTGLSTVDCFALIREGFCEQYATTMTMLMRMKGFPARYVQGYLPGAVDQHSLVEQVTSEQKHAWVEVYFPGYGWIPFDPTGGGVGLPTQLVPGAAVSPTPTPAAPSPGGTNSDVRPRGGSSPPGSGTTTSSTGLTTLFIPAILVAVILLALFVLWRRRPRRLEGPDSVYRNVVRLASRLGYKPQPTQTVYEYTGMLADVVPRARDSLGVVAMATVEVTYGRRQLGSERLVSLAAAQRLVRQALLRLAFRIPRFRRRAKPGGPAKRPRGSRRSWS
ncbi:MAG: DUF4129 domain-containing transglutaminase family protein [Candidatus Limnocylindrales bacterium]